MHGNETGDIRTFRRAMLCIFVPVTLILLWLVWLCTSAVGQPLKIWHRGDHRQHPENTPEAFTSACNNGDGFECDIRMSRDGVLYVFHDPTLDRVTSMTGSVSKYDYWQMRRAIPGYIIPTLAEVLQYAKNAGCWVLLDCKESVVNEVALMAEYYSIKVVKINNYRGRSKLKKRFPPQEIYVPNR